MNVNFLGVNLSYNFVNTIVLLAFIWNYRVINKRAVQWRLFKPFLLLYILLCVAIPFQNGVAFSYGINYFRMETMSYLIFPFVMWNVMINDEKSVILYRVIAISCIFIIASYGLFLTKTDGLNPYMLVMSALNGTEFNEEYVMKGGGRMFGRLSSVYPHPMTFALNIGLFLIYIYSLKDKISKWVLFPILILVSINVFTCGVRSVIGGLIIAVAYFLIKNRNFKVLLSACIVGVVGYYIISHIPEMASYVSSIADVNAKKTDVGGSSIDMRLTQLNGCFDEISDCLFFGKGYGWTTYYMSIREVHPVILAFESLIFVVLCNWGIWGIMVWSLFLYKWLKTTKLMCHLKEYIMPYSLMVFYLAYCCITGEYGYMKYFVIFYVLMMGETQYKKT